MKIPQGLATKEDENKLEQLLEGPKIRKLEQKKRWDLNVEEMKSYSYRIGNILRNEGYELANIRGSRSAYNSEDFTIIGVIKPRPRKFKILRRRGFYLGYIKLLPLWNAEFRAFGRANIEQVRTITNHVNDETELDIQVKLLDERIMYERTRWDGWLR